VNASTQALRRVAGGLGFFVAALCAHWLLLFALVGLSFDAYYPRRGFELILFGLLWLGTAFHVLGLFLAGATPAEARGRGPLVAGLVLDLLLAGWGGALFAARLAGTVDMRGLALWFGTAGVLLLLLPHAASLAYRRRLAHYLREGELEVGAETGFVPGIVFLLLWEVGVAFILVSSLHGWGRSLLNSINPIPGDDGSAFRTVLLVLYLLALAALSAAALGRCMGMLVRTRSAIRRHVEVTDATDKQRRRWLPMPW
jgi:hypothetical protein